MIIQNAYNQTCKEYLRTDDILEGFISNSKLNSTPLERRLSLVNTGSKRRLRNNHAQRLAKFKQQ